jgi:hypothetical protein
MVILDDIVENDYDSAQDCVAVKQLDKNRIEGLKGNLDTIGTT